MITDFSFFKKLKRNKLLLSCVPDIITILRIIITFITICFLENGQSNINIFILMNILIFITDFMDGRIARYLKAESNTGELLDIAADIFYVFSMSAIMCLKGIIPFYYVFVVAAEFCAFIVTSKYIKKDKKYFGFDILGRVLAVLYYIIPAVMFVLFEKNKIIYSCVYNFVFIITSLSSLVVILYRTSMCLMKIKIYNNDEIFEEEK